MHADAVFRRDAAAERLRSRKRTFGVIGLNRRADGGLSRSTLRCRLPPSPKSARSGRQRFSQASELEHAEHSSANAHDRQGTDIEIHRSHLHQEDLDRTLAADAAAGRAPAPAIAPTASGPTAVEGSDGQHLLELRLQSDASGTRHVHQRRVGHSIGELAQAGRACVARS